MDVDFDTMTWSCSNNFAKCPGDLMSFGCPELLCSFSTNTLGECGCEGQLFIGNHCTEGFYCSSNIPNPLIHDGCIKKCQEDQILVPDFANNDWACIEDTDDIVCPGAYHMECPENEIIVNDNFDSSQCECDGQLWIDKTCQSTFFCLGLDPNGGSYHRCPSGQVVNIDIQNQEIGCTKDVGQCPTLGGGFKIGCQPDTPPVEPVECTWAKNDLGTCSCNHELFISDDCAKSFYCVDFSPPEEGDVDGCVLDCSAEDKIVHLDVATSTWECIEPASDFTCPGAFNLDCRNSFDVVCGCENEIWVNGNCDKAFKCNSPNDQGFNDGAILTCPEGTTLDIDFSNKPFDLRLCTSDAGQCPGSFHYGCGAEVMTTESTTAQPTTGQPTTTPDPNSATQASFSFMFLCSMLLLTCLF